MAYNPDIHHRRSIRLKEYDYSSAGAYFVTICVQERLRMFGNIVKGELFPNDAGRMVDERWSKLPDKFPHLALDEYVIMPNHFHGIIILNDVGRRGVTLCSPASNGSALCSPAFNQIQNRGNRMGDRGEYKNQNRGEHKVTPLRDQKYGDRIDRTNGTTDNSLGRVMQEFKSTTTVEYGRGVKEHGWLPFPGRLWQRNYYERVIRDDGELSVIREYIRSNPANWLNDEQYQP